MQVSEHHRIANLRSQCGEQLRPALASSSPPHALGSVPRGTVPCGPLCWPLSSNVSCRDHGSAFSQQQSAEVSKVSLGQAPPVQACSWRRWSQRVLVLARYKALQGNHGPGRSFHARGPRQAAAILPREGRALARSSAP